VKRVAIANPDLAGLARIAELLGQLQQSDLGADDLLFGVHDGVNYLFHTGGAPLVARY
jgi:hypothetical protein